MNGSKRIVVRWGQIGAVQVRFETLSAGHWQPTLDEVCCGEQAAGVFLCLSALAAVTREDEVPPKLRRMLARMGRTLARIERERDGYTDTD